MTDRNWDRELAKIDRQLEKVSDEAVFPAKAAPTPAARVEAEVKQGSTSTIGVFARLALAVTLGVAILFWPYAARCGFGLGAYLGATAAVALGGVWSGVWTWKHRAARAHLLALLLVVWGGLLAAIEILPRTGYAFPTEAHPASWNCR